MTSSCSCAGHENDTWLDWLKHGWLANAGSNADAGLTSAAAQVGYALLIFLTLKFPRIPGISPSCAGIVLLRRSLKRLLQSA